MFISSTRFLSNRLITFILILPIKLYGQTDALEIGSIAPKFSIMSLSGDNFYSADFYGMPRTLPTAKKERSPVVLSFFASWCSPCRKEIPQLELLQNRYPEAKIFLINVGEDKETIERYLQKNPARLPIIMDIYGKVAEKFKVKEIATGQAILPSLIMIEGQGKIHFYKKGFVDGEEAKIESELSELIRRSKQ